MTRACLFLRRHSYQPVPRMPRWLQRVLAWL